MSTKHGKAWADIEEEDDVQTSFPVPKSEERSGGVYKYSQVTRPIDKIHNDGNVERIDQAYLVKKWVHPVRQQVLDRKKLAKFGDVKNVPKGEHKPGDYTLEAPVTIDKAEEQGETGIVSQIENINRDQILLKRAQRELEKPQAAKTEEVKGDKWSSMFSGAAARSNFAIRITNIISYEDKIEDIEADLQEYFRLLLEKKANIRLGRVKLIKSRDEPPRFLNKCILTFDTQENAAKALTAVDGATYNDAELEASWAEPNGPRRK